MKRSKPMKRSGFKRQAIERVRTMPQRSSVAPSACRMWDGKATLTVPVPKFPYVRDERYRTACRAMACQNCGAAGDSAGVTWAHSNWPEHGKAGAIKASDQYVAALCWDCHRWLDQGKASAKTKRAMWDAAHAATVKRGKELGLWPAEETP
jgi:hypothetical protein